MPKRIASCPFCGHAGEATKEHVWAQWLHKTPGGRKILEQSHGERIPNVRHVMKRGDDGRYHAVAESAGSYARDLPHVTVAVCSTCNNGWMSRLETAASAILSGFVLDHRAVELNTDDLVSLSTWATKSWLAYALTKSYQENPFRDAEYRAIAAGGVAPLRSRIWLLHSHGSHAHVGIEVWPLLLTGPGPLPDMETAPANAAFAYLAVSELVMFMIMMPEDLPEEVWDAVSPRSLHCPGVRCSWPSPSPQSFPLEPLTDQELDGLLAAPAEFLEITGLPVEDRDDTELGEIRQQFLDGAIPRDLRSGG